MVGNGAGAQHHAWEELDDLEYVVGDDVRPTAKNVNMVGLRTPGSPFTSQRQDF